MPGLASHIEVGNTARISFTQLETQIHGDVSITGNLTVSGTGGSLSAPVKSGLTTDGTEIKLNHDNASIVGFTDALNVSGWIEWGNRFDAFYTYPSGHASFKNRRCGIYA